MLLIICKWRINGTEKITSKERKIRMCVFLYDVKVNSNHDIRLKARISFFIRPSLFWLSLKRGFGGYGHFSFFRNVFLEFFIQDFFQHLTKLRQLNWLDKTLLSGLVMEFNSEIYSRNKTFKNLKNTCRIKCLFIFVPYISAVQLYSKRGSGAVVFLWMLGNFQEHLFLQNISSGCFCQYDLSKIQIDFCFWHSIKAFLLIFVLFFLSSSLKEEL